MFEERESLSSAHPSVLLATMLRGTYLEEFQDSKLDTFSSSWSDIALNIQTHGYSIILLFSPTT